MRAARSSSELKTTARPSFSNSLGSAAERFRIAPFGASDPNSATSPPCFDNGSENGGLVALRSEEHTSELQSLTNLVCRLLLEKKKKKIKNIITTNNERDI